MPINHPNIDDQIHHDSVNATKDTEALGQRVLQALNEAFEQHPILEEFGLVLSDRTSNMQEFIAAATDSPEVCRVYGDGAIVVIGSRIAVAYWSLPHLMKEASKELKILSTEKTCKSRTTHLTSSVSVEFTTCSLSRACC